jgi:DNA-binding SARP family transcriptional activator
MSAAPSLGNAICAVYWTLRERIVQASANGSGSQPMLSMLQVLHETVGADAGSLVMWDERSRRVQQTSFFGAAPPSCPWLAAPETSPCSSRENQSCFRLIALAGPDDRWPEPCRQMQFDGPTVCCIPVTGQAARGGRVLLGFRRNPPDSPVRLLVPLQVMVEQMGLHLQEPVSPQIAVALEPAVPQLQIRCFGHFEVVIGGKNLPPSAFQRRDALTLLKVLVLRAGKHLHRTKLIEWLWPDADETAGINRLHGVVHALRTVIEPHAAERRWKYVLNEGDTYTFCPGDSTSVDLISFQELLALARRDLRDGVFAPHITHYLEQAVELYRGDLFEDDLYGEWCDVERVAVQREFIDALANLARVYLTLGEAKRAIVALRRALCHDPSREDLHHELIRCLMRLKRHQEAKQQVAGCVRYLREELGVEPGSETLRLHHSLVTGAHGA